MIILTTFFLCSSSCNQNQQSSKHTRGSQDYLTKGDAKGAAKVQDKEYAALKDLSVDDLKEKYKKYKKQNDSDEAELQIVNFQNQAFCNQLVSIKQKCDISKRLIPDGLKGLKCSAQKQQDESPAEFEVTVPESDPGPFVLVFNKSYMSTPFNGGTSKITFNTDNRGKALQAPQVKAIYKADIRRANESVDEIIKGKANKLPEKDTFNVKVTLGETTIFDGSPLDYGENKFKDYRYMLNPYMIDKERRSNDCTFTEGWFNGIRDKIREQVEDQLGITRQQDYANKLKGKSSVNIGSKPTLMREIESLKDKIADRRPISEDARNRLLRIKNELLPETSFGCHADEPIKSIRLAVSGSSLPDKAIDSGQRQDHQWVATGSGSASTLKFSFGPNVSLSIDQSKTSIFGSQGYKSGLDDEALVKDISYLSIEKKGISFDNQQFQESGILGVGQQTLYNVFERYIFTINNIKVYVNEHLIYSEDVSIRLASSRSNGVLRWSAQNFRANENWIKFMSDTACDETN